MYDKCEMCPRRCKVNRAETAGFCKSPAVPRVAKVMPHFGEEPVISGTRGSGAVFFSGCVLRCPFCQNFPISHELYGRDISESGLEEIILGLRDKGVHNINLVTPTQYTDSIVNVLKKIKPRLNIPIVYNTGGYELTEQLERLEGLVDIFLPDLKYHSPELSKKYCGAGDYFERAFSAIEEMIRQQPENVIENGIMKKGVIIRHLVLPGCYRDSLEIFRALYKRYNEKLPLISVMRQYTPCYGAENFPELNRKITTFEYDKVTSFCAELGFNGFTQMKGCESLEMTPDFTGAAED